MARYAVAAYAIVLAGCATAPPTPQQMMHYSKPGADQTQFMRDRYDDGSVARLPCDSRRENHQLQRHAAASANMKIQAYLTAGRRDQCLAQRRGEELLADTRRGAAAARSTRGGSRLRRRRSELAETWLVGRSGWGDCRQRLRRSGRHRGRPCRACLRARAQERRRHP